MARLTEHPWKWKLFTYLLTTANLEPGEFRGTTINRGELIRSVRSIQKELSYTIEQPIDRASVRKDIAISTIHDMIKRFCTEHLIDYFDRTGQKVIKINEFDKLVALPTRYLVQVETSTNRTDYYSSINNIYNNYNNKLSTSIHNSQNHAKQHKNPAAMLIYLDQAANILRIKGEEDFEAYCERMAISDADRDRVRTSVNTPINLDFANVKKRVKRAASDPRHIGDVIKL